MADLLKPGTWSIFQFAKKPDQENVKEVKGGEEAYSERSILYTKGDFPKYNPDDLIGKKGCPIYTRMMIDEQVKAAVRFKRDAITSRDHVFTLDAEKYGISAKEAKRRIKVMNRIVEEMDGSFIDAINGIYTATYNGVSYTEKVLRLLQIDGVTWYGIKKLKLRPYDTFKFVVDEYGNIISLIQCGYGKDKYIDMDKMIHYVVQPEQDEHYGQSELRAAYRAWFSKDIIIKFQNMHLEKHAGGVRWAQVREGKSLTPNSSEYMTLQHVLGNINTATGMIMPSAVELKSEYPSNTTAFLDAIKNCDMQIARALLVPPLLGVSPQGDIGSFAQSKTQFEAFMWTLESDTARLEEALNEQLFRELGMLNFGDEAWPRFSFKPLSKAATIEALTNWNTLVAGGTVTATQKDEAYIRELLEMPALENIADDSGALLNGAQVSSLLEVVRAVSVGELSEDGAVELIVSAFGMEVEKASTIVEGAVKKAEEPVEEPAATDAVVDENGNPVPPKTDDETPKDDAATDEPDAEMSKDKKPLPDETVIGIKQIQTTAYARAESRVDFKVIAHSSDAVTEEYTNKTGDIGMEIALDMIERAKTASPSLADSVQPAIDQLKPDSKMLKRLNKTYAAMLTEGRMIGHKHAESEIDKVMRKSFSMSVNRDRLKFIADDYYKMTAFKLSGNLSDEYVKIIEQEILNGAKQGKAWDVIEEGIYQVLSSKGMVPVEYARDLLGEALGVENPDARLRTITRTSTFDAINQARHSYFTDPELGGFVEAYEYSAILDNRTTEICRHLDEDDAGDHSVEWYERNAQYVPPNHYNAIAGGELIQTDRGLIPIEHVAVGDKALTHMGRYMPVYAVMAKPNDTDKVRKITTSSGDVILVTDEHPILTANGWHRADKIKVGQQVFQRGEQWRELPVNSASKVQQAVLIDAHNRPSEFDESGVSYVIGSTARGMTSAINLKVHSVAQRKIQNVAFNGDLESVSDAEVVKEFAHPGFVIGRISSVFDRAANGRLVPILDMLHWVFGKHVGRVSGGKISGLFGMLGAPVIAAFGRISVGHEHAGGLALASNGYPVALADTNECGLAESHLSFDGSNGHSLPVMLVSNQLSNGVNLHSGLSGWFESTIISNDDTPYNGNVYNIAVEEDESYMASNILVHNCRSILIPVTTVDKDFVEGPEPNLEPQLGFIAKKGEKK